MDVILTMDKYHREVILVNDGSKDVTWQIIHDLSQTYDIIKGVNFSRNFGKEIALSA
jgi:glycosyltransferase involved in cell wall biosynthesis